MKKALFILFLLISFLGFSQEQLYIPHEDTKIATFMLPEGWSAEYGDDFLKIINEEFSESIVEDFLLNDRYGFIKD